MSWLRRLFGFAQAPASTGGDASEEGDEDGAPSSSGRDAAPGPAKGRGVPGAAGRQRQHTRRKAEVAAHAAAAAAPVLEETHVGVNGGVQGLAWYAASMQQDAEGDVAGGFVGEEGAAEQGGGALKAQVCAPGKPQLKVERVEQGNVVLG